MKLVRKRLTYANVMSSLAVFLVLAGGTAFAASQLGKNSVGTKQLKKNAVTKAKIKKNSVTGAKIKNGAVNGAKIADGSITGAEINAASTAFSQRVQRLVQAGPFAIAGQHQLVGSYTQPAGEDDQYIAGMDVNFPASCTSPRSAIALLIKDPADPAKPTPLEFEGIGYAVDEKGVGAGTTKLEFSPYEIFGSLTSLAPTTPTNHTFYVLLAEENCNAGGGVTATNVTVDVIGTK